MTTTRRSLLALDLAARLQAQDVAEDDGGLIKYAERLARRREKERALTMRHLAKVARLYERALAGECVRAVACAPQRHGKTTLDQAAILRHLRHRPTDKINFGAYASDLAEAKMFEVRTLAPGEGIRLDPNFQTDAEWRTAQGGGVKSGGLIGGPWVGQGANLAIICDPYKNAEQASSRAFRLKTREQFDSAFMSRLEPGASVIVNASRWHPDDLSGQLIREGWESVCLQAISDDGLPLWPERWSLEELLQIKASNPWWNALYQGKPRPEEGHIFDPAHLLTYDRLPVGAYPYREAMGVDLAYGARARHDRSALVAFRHYQHLPRQLFLVDAWAGHEAVELFACRVAASQVERGGGARLVLPRSADEIERTWRPQLLTVKGARRVACRWYTSTTEAGTAAMMSGYGASVTAIRAAVDKLARAQAGGYTAAWSEGRVLVPARGGEHVDAWRVAHEDFTGADGDADDPIDASVAAHDEMGLPAPASLGGGGVRVGGSWGYGGAREC
jgi:hypothetical protein